MNKKLVTILSGISLTLALSGCNTDKSLNTKNDSDTLYTYVNQASADAQFDSNIGLASEQPVLDNNGQTIGKRLFVDSSKELLNKDSIIEFYTYIKNTDINYEEIIISIGNNEAIQVNLDNYEAWYCNINDNMEITKIKKIQY